MEKLYALKTFLKTAGGRMHTPHPTPWIRLRHNHRIHQESGIFQTLGAIYFLFFTIKQSRKGGGAWHNPSP